jgi:hypothetical protein
MKNRKEFLGQKMVTGNSQHTIEALFTQENKAKAMPTTKMFARSKPCKF